MDGTVADTFAPLITALFGGPPPLPIEFWDGSRTGPPGEGPSVRITSPDAARRIVWAPGELGFSRAFVCGDIEVHGNLAAAVRVMEAAVRGDPKRLASTVMPALRAVRETGALASPLSPPPEEVLPKGLRHSIARDRAAVSHHYDVGNEFYELVLGPSMTYSCARFATDDTTLEDAQAAKHELICRKLGLQCHARDESPRLLDVGCGWGSMAMHAAQDHGCRVVGITISEQQAMAARKRVAEAGLTDRIDIRLQDYRLVDDGPFDAISSVGMSEHVGRRRMGQYFETLHLLLRPQGRLLNHAISSPGGSRIGSRSFIGRYVFPDGELLDVGETMETMQEAGFEVRDVESLREHYATTLRCWVANLERNWDDAVRIVGERRARVWRLYMSGSILRFEDAHIGVHQVLGVRADAAGASGMPLTRAGWEPAAG